MEVSVSFVVIPLDIKNLSVHLNVWINCSGRKKITKGKTNKKTRGTINRCKKCENYKAAHISNKPFKKVKKNKLL